MISGKLQAPPLLDRILRLFAPEFMALWAAIAGAIFALR
jgi:hypothetical protein